MSPPDQAVARDARREIARRFVALFKEFVGRGPTSARAYFNEDLVLVLLEDTLTKGERTLADEDRVPLVREQRELLGFVGRQRHAGQGSELSSGQDVAEEERELDC